MTCPRGQEVEENYFQKEIDRKGFKFIIKSKIKKQRAYIVRFQVLTAASMKMSIFWDVAPRSLVEVYRRFKGACFLHHQGHS
jgi:hypothetical protein